MSVYRGNVSKRIYKVIDTQVADLTDSKSDDEVQMVLFESLDGKRFVMEFKEFFDNFTEINTQVVHPIPPTIANISENKC